MAAKPKPKCPMPAAERAKQFMSFSAVKGLNAALRRKEQELGLTPPKIIPEEAAAELDAKLRRLQKGSRVAITYFSAGRYLKSSGQVLAIDSVRRRLLLSGVEESKLSIVFDDIIAISLF